MAPKLSLRGSVGRYSGGNPNVWLSNAWSNDGVTNVQSRIIRYQQRGIPRCFDGSHPLTGPDPGVDVPQELFDFRSPATTAANASHQPLGADRSELRAAVRVEVLDWASPIASSNGYQVDFDYLHTELVDSAYLRRRLPGRSSGRRRGRSQPIYDYVPRGSRTTSC